jgi:hypothetical protein
MPTTTSPLTTPRSGFVQRAFRTPKEGEGGVWENSFIRRVRSRKANASITIFPRREAHSDDPEKLARGVEPDPLFDGLPMP